MFSKQLSILGAAVVASLSAGSAFAIAPTGPFAVSLTISGASAFEGAVESELSRVGSSICRNPTAATATYNRFLSSSADFRAYTCNLAPNVLSTAGGEAAVIYYRGEGGSVYALKPLLAGGPQPKRLALSGCPTGTPAAGITVTCTIGSFNLATESTAPVAGLENAPSQLGFADIEPTQFFGENYPTAPFLQPAMNDTQRATLTNASEVLVGQAFGVYVNTANAALKAVTSLPRTIIANIFQGVYADWSAVPNGAGGTVTSAPLPIKLCRREAGSGTQVAASIFFNNYPTTGAAFASESNQGALDPSLGGGGVVEAASSGAVRTCLSDGFVVGSTSDAAGAIGVISSEADAAGRQQIQIDGQGSSILEGANNLGTVIATGLYDFWYEEVAIKSPTLTGGALTLANKLIPVTRVQATGPSSPNVAFLSPFNAAAFPPAVVVGKQPTSCLRRNKVSTSIPVWQC